MCPVNETTLPCVATPPATQYPEHERIAAYWLLVSAFEHVNRAYRGDFRLGGHPLHLISEARWAVLSGLPLEVMGSLVDDHARHEAIQDRRRYLMQLESKAGAR